MVSKHTHFEKLVVKPEIGPNEKIEVTLNKAKDHFVITFLNFYMRKDHETGEEIKTPCGPSSATRRFQQRFFESKHLTSAYPTERISVPVVDTSAIILSAWPILQSYYQTDALQKVFQLSQLVKKQRKAAELVAKYKEQGIYDNGVFKVSEKHPLATYQKVALHASTIAGNYGLFMEQGTGKTAVDIARICHEAEEAAKQGKYYRGIVICPKNVRFNWSCEIEKFATCKGKVQIISGPQTDRNNQMIEALIAKEESDKFVILVMNYETLKTCMEAFTFCCALLSQMEKDFTFGKSPLFDLGILDESHYIKTPSAQRSKACMELRTFCKHRMVLTGTPVTNNVFDLHMQLEFLYKGGSGFSSFSADKNFYGVWETGYAGYDKLVDLQNISILKERLSRLSFQIRKEEALPDLPDKVYDRYEVEMTVQQIELYKKIAAELVAEIEMEQATGKVKKEFMVNHILTKLLRLAQVTSGFVGFPEVCDELTGVVLEERSEHILDKNPKIDALIEILKEKDPSQKTIIWACFVTDIKSISARLTAEGIKHVTYYGATSDIQREAAVKGFNEDKEVKVFLANPAAASTGLNLLGYPPGNGDDYETNCDHAIYFSQNWSADKRVQSEDRCHRRGTRQNVRITDLVVPSTIDTEIRKRVEQKREMAESTTDVTEILQGIMSSLTNLI